MSISDANALFETRSYLGNSIRRCLIDGRYWWMLRDITNKVVPLRNQRRILTVSAECRKAGPHVRSPFLLTAEGLRTAYQEQAQEDVGVEQFLKWIESLSAPVVEEATALPPPTAVPVSSDLFSTAESDPVDTVRRERGVRPDMGIPSAVSASTITDDEERPVESADLTTITDPATLAVWCTVMFRETPIRAARRGNQVLFCGVDVARAAGTKNPIRAVNRVAEEFKIVISRECHSALTGESQSHALLMLPLTGVMQMLTHMRSPTVNAFWRWVLEDGNGEIAQIPIPTGDDPGLDADPPLPPRAEEGNDGIVPGLLRHIAAAFGQAADGLNAADQQAETQLWSVRDEVTEIRKIVEKLAAGVRDVQASQRRVQKWMAREAAQAVPANADPDETSGELFSEA